MDNKDLPAMPLANDSYQDLNQGACRYEDGMGLTKREYFAGLAMQGLCSNPNTKESLRDGAASILAVRIADALLKALEL